MENFLSSLFDFSFRRFITPSLLKFIYVVAVLLAALQALAIVLAGFSQGIFAGLVALVMAPVIFLFVVCFTRVGLETVLSVFRIANYAAETARAQRKPGANPGTTVAPDDHEPPPPPPPVAKPTDLKSGF